MTSVVTQNEEEQLHAAETRAEELRAQIATEAPLVAALAQQIAMQAGGVGHQHPRLGELTSRQSQLAGLKAALVVQMRVITERRAAASRARSEARREEYDALVCSHLERVLGVVASMREIERFIGEVTDGGFEFTLAQRFLFRDLGDFDDRLSAVRLLFREAQDAGFPLPDVEPFGFQPPAELFAKEVAQ